MRKIEKTPYYSYRIGNLPKGCQLCVKGLKTVLFITGLCSRKPLCYYCPVSDKKLEKDVVYVNEWPTMSLKDLEKEIRLCSSKGIGITGGDPLITIRRCIRYIKYLKRRFGNKFHIHLYTPLNLVNKNNLKKLFGAGLDEIRFHPDLDDNKLWPRIRLAKVFRWKIGIEIPVIPGKKRQITKLIDFIKDNVDFLNLNELEVADNKVSRLMDLGYRTKDFLSYGVKGSEELAKYLLEYCSKTRLNVHYCPSKLKDRVQLAKRIKRRAKNIKKPYDRLTKEGMLIRGAIYLKELCPSADYKKILKTVNKNMVIKKLASIKRDIEKSFFVGKELIEIDNHKLRILIAPIKIRQIRKYLAKNNLITAIVEEYPTYDSIEIEIDFLD